MGVYKTELVQVEGNTIFCDSRMVAKKFGIKHSQVVSVIVRTIEKLQDTVSSLGLQRLPVFNKQKAAYLGQRFTVYKMDRAAFSLIAMRFETESAFSWQLQFVEAFAIMEDNLKHVALHRANDEWRQTRSYGKPVRCVAMDVVKVFVEYATSQGSKSAKMYYMNISKMENTALFFLEQKFPNVRDALDIEQLMTVAVVDNIVQRALTEGMSNNLYYKDIYQLAKHRVEDFVLLSGKSVVPSKTTLLT